MHFCKLHFSNEILSGVPRLNSPAKAAYPAEQAESIISSLVFASTSEKTPACWTEKAGMSHNAFFGSLLPRFANS